MTYTRRLLYKNPIFLARVRVEHDSVLSEDVAAARDVLANDPTLLNQQTLTYVAIKDTIRFSCPGGGIRMEYLGITLAAEDRT